MDLFTTKKIDAFPFVLRELAINPILVDWPSVFNLLEEECFQLPEGTQVIRIGANEVAIHQTFDEHRQRINFPTCFIFPFNGQDHNDFHGTIAVLRGQAEISYIQPNKNQHQLLAGDIHEINPKWYTKFELSFGIGSILIFDETDRRHNQTINFAMQEVSSPPFYKNIVKNIIPTPTQTP